MQVPLCEIEIMKSEQKCKEGVRERKRREMYRRITDAGLKLFAEQGYEETTLEAIAEASGIARRTFFHYFSAKEEIILAWQKAVPGKLHAEIHRLGVNVSPAATVQMALTGLAAHMQPDIAVLIGKIVQSTQQLQLGNQAKFLRMEHAAYDALCGLWPDPARRVELRLAAMAGVGAMRLSIEDWVADGCSKPLTDHLMTNIGCLNTEINGGL